MNRTLKNLGAVLLAVCMVMTLLPMTAFAASGSIDMGSTTVIDNIGSPIAPGTGGWAWNEASATLTLSAGYVGGPIYFNTTDPVNLV